MKKMGIVERRAIEAVFQAVGEKDKEPPAGLVSRSGDVASKKVLYWGQFFEDDGAKSPIKVSKPSVDAGQQGMGDEEQIALLESIMSGGNDIDIGCDMVMSERSDSFDSHDIFKRGLQRTVETSWSRVGR